MERGQRGRDRGSGKALLQVKAINPYHFTRAWILNHWLDALQHEVEDATALEIGRLRSLTEVTGHSTLHIATHPVVSTFYSLDNNPKTEAACRRLLPDSALDGIVFVNGDGVKWLADTVARDGLTFDFIYLDAANDAEQGRELLACCAGVSRRGTIIIMDDTDHPRVHKGDSAIPYALKHPNLFEVVVQYSRDHNSQGMTVIRAKGLPRG